MVTPACSLSDETALRTDEARNPTSRDEVGELAARIVAAAEARGKASTTRPGAPARKTRTPFALEDESSRVVTTTTEEALPTERDDDGRVPMLLGPPEDVVGSPNPDLLLAVAAQNPESSGSDGVAFADAPSRQPSTIRPLPLVRSPMVLPKSGSAAPASISVSEADGPARARLDAVRTAEGGTKSALPPGIRVTPLATRAPYPPENDPFPDIGVGLSDENPGEKAIGAQRFIEAPESVGFGASATKN
ncbi:hypothetical protein BH23VER1_BH23VER1_22330 [soil metagenome]